MKSFLISLGVLLCVIALIIVNCIYINGVTDKLAKATENLTQGTGIDELCAIWEHEKFAVCLSTTHRATDDVEKYIQILKTKVENSSFDDFEEHKKMLLIAIEEIKKTEEVSLNAIF